MSQDGAETKKGESARGTRKASTEASRRLVATGLTTKVAQRASLVATGMTTNVEQRDRPVDSTRRLDDQDSTSETIFGF